MPESVTKVDANAFASNTKLTTLTLTKNIASIDSTSFYNTPKLTTIKFKGTQAEWNAMAWKDLFAGKTIVYNA